MKFTHHNEPTGISTFNPPLTLYSKLLKINTF
ncbi:uncharacterized protein METZ01_LOCUS207159, partial [marine metagenome]